MNRQNTFRRTTVTWTSIALASILMVVTGGCDELRPRCQNQVDCLVNCDCSDDDTNIGYQCGIQYRCDLTADLCEEDIVDADCEAICDLAETLQCYTARCDANTRCIRTAECMATVAGNMMSFPCEREFACENDLCAADFTMSDTELCQRCFDDG